MEQSLSLQRVIDLRIRNLDRQPGPIHSIREDAEHNLYCTDEINHTMFSVDESGTYRWHREGSGNAAGEFWYPRGLDLGWIGGGAEKKNCVAVCDSWNHRIRFFDRDGGFLCDWKEAGGTPFSEVVDIRFIDSSNVSECAWVVLDRGNHSVFGLDPSGRSLFRTGHQIGSSLENRWFPDNWTKHGPTLGRPSVLDPLYQPFRIFGSSWEDLFIWEPLSGKLKHLFMDSLTPVWIDAPHDAEWIAADSKGFLSWSRTSGILTCCQIGEKDWPSLRINGTPIPSGRGSNEVWVQEEDRITHLIRSDYPGDEYGTADKSACHRRLAHELSRPDSIASLPGKIAEPLRIVDELVSLCRKMLEILSAAEGINDLPGAPLKSEYRSLLDRFSLAVPDIRRSLHPAYLTVHKLQQIPLADTSAENREVFELAKKWLTCVMRELEDRFAAVHECRDDVTFGIKDRLSLVGESSQTGKGILDAVLELNNDLLSVSSRLALCSGPLTKMDRTLGNTQIADKRGPNESSGTPWIQGRGAKTGAESRHLREIDRISLQGTGVSSPAGPVGLAKLGDHILVAAFNSNRIIELDGDGKMLGPLALSDTLNGPYGIAVDDNGKVWVVQVMSHNIRVIDTVSHRVDTLEDLTEAAPRFYFPNGICHWAPGRMIVADSQNHRIVVLSDTGGYEVVCDRFGQSPGEFRIPLSVTPDLQGSGFWVVDQRNHRVQHFDSFGNPVEVIGTCGIGEGRLVLPESVIQFPDGVLAVSQYFCLKNLKLFSPEGKEIDCMPLDYSPRGILAHRNLLLVSEGDSDFLRVYERS